MPKASPKNSPEIMPTLPVLGVLAAFLPKIHTPHRK
jgi:hypothetical protein